MAPLNLEMQLFIDGAWVTYPGIQNGGWGVTIGPDVETGTRPSKIEFQFNNDSLALDPGNPSSLLYGKIGRNTPARLLINGVALTLAEASSWMPDRTINHVPGAGKGLATVDFTAEGLLRRLGRWTDPIESPIRRQIGSANGLTGYWPLEDPSGAAELQNAVTNGAPARFSGSVSLAGNDGAGGSAPVVELGSDGSLRGSFLRSTASGYQICWSQQLGVTPSTTSLTTFAWTDTRGRTWQWLHNDASVTLNVTASDGTSLLSSVYLFVGSLANWNRFRVMVTVSAGTVTADFRWYSQDEAVAWVGSGTFADTATGQPATWYVSPTTYTDGAGYGHVFATTDTSINIISAGAPRASFNGYLGERAGDRFFRLMDEQGLNAYTGGNSAVSVPMGRQKPGILVDLLTECAVTDGGLLYDELTNVALALAMFNGQINATPALTLSTTTPGVVAYPLQKVIDDVGVVNDVTLTNFDGTTKNAQLTTGPLSVQPPPAGVGRYKGGSDLPINVANTWWLEQRTNWELRKNTLDRTRYPKIVIDLLANPGLTSAVTNLRPGHWISLAGAEPDTLLLRVISKERQGDAVRDTVVLNCVPADLYMVAQYDTPSTTRQGSASTTLAAAPGTTGTTLLLTTSNAGDVWSTTSLPYDCVVAPAGKLAGERVTVTAMTAPAGTGPYTQTATVVRSVNGVTCTPAAGWTFNIWRTVRYGLG